MATLPELLKPDTEITIQGNVYTAKILNLLEMAEVSSEMERAEKERGETYGNTYGMLYLLYKSLLKNYPEVTLEYVATMVSGEDATNLATIVSQLGGLAPKAPTGEDSLPTSVTEQAGLPETLAN